MALARLLGFDLCPRLKELKQRHLYVPRGTIIPPEIAAVCEATVDTALIEKHWDTLVHLAASVMSGNASAVAALARFGSAARFAPGSFLIGSFLLCGSLYLAPYYRGPVQFAAGCIGSAGLLVGWIGLIAAAGSIARGTP